MNHYRTNSALKNFGLAVSAYVLALGLGAIVGSLYADPETVTDLGIYALTLVVFAPLSALAASLVGLRIFGDPSRRPMSRSTRLLVAVVIVILFLGPGLPLGISGAILGTAAMAVYRTGLSTVEVWELTVGRV